MKKLIITAVVVLVVLLGWYYFGTNKSSTSDQTNTGATTTATTSADQMKIAQALIDAKKDLIALDTLKAGDNVSSPLLITGKARGTWYFEASFPIELLDANRKVLAQGIGSAQDDWMTENFVPFSLTLNFKAPKSGSVGFLILHKDNPSGMPENEDSIEVPIVFK